LLLVILWISNSLKKEKLRIGLILSLTGPLQDFGREVRDSAQLTTKIINESGGVAGRKIELLIRDNKNSIEETKKNLDELESQGIVALIGPVQSSVAAQLFPIINENKIPTFSPGAGSTKIPELDDYFFRMRSSNRDDAQMLCELMKRKSLKNISFVYDLQLKIFGLDLLENLQTTCPNLILYKYEIDLTKIKYKRSAEEILKNRPQAVVLATDFFASALLIQHLKNLSENVLIILTPRARIHKIIERVGKRKAEGIMAIELIDFEYKGKEFLRFKEEFKKKYGYLPGFLAVYTYESLMIIKKALEKNPSPAELKDTILKIREFEGLQGKVIIDRNGNTIRKPLILIIKDSKLERLDE